MPHVLMGLNVVQLMEPSISISWVCLCEVFCYAKIKCSLPFYIWDMHTYTRLHIHNIISHTITHIH